LPGRPPGRARGRGFEGCTRGRGDSRTWAALALPALQRGVTLARLLVFLQRRTRSAGLWTGLTRVLSELSRVWIPRPKLPLLQLPEACQGWCRGLGSRAGVGLGEVVEVAAVRGRWVEARSGKLFLWVFREAAEPATVFVAAASSRRMENCYLEVFKRTLGKDIFLLIYFDASDKLCYLILSMRRYQDVRLRV